MFFLLLLGIYDIPDGPERFVSVINSKKQKTYFDSPAMYNLTKGFLSESSPRYQCFQGLFWLNVLCRR